MSHVGVGADLIWNCLHTFHTHGPGDILALFLVNDPLHHEVDVHALCLESGGADLNLITEY